MRRGEIVLRDRAKQLRDYSGLQFAGGITPTDVDGYLDFGNKVTVFVEFKYGDAPLPYGQRLALERLVDDVSMTKPAILIVAQHSHHPLEDIQAHRATVSSYRYKFKWRSPVRPIELRQAIVRFLEMIAKRSRSTTGESGTPQRRKARNERTHRR